VAYDERLFPSEWIAPEGNGVLEPFIDWVKPLAGDITPRQRLEGV
jgi:hypothetical protein